MKIPKRIKIGGRTWSVKYPHEFQERSDANGITFNDKQAIFITERDGTGEKRPFEATIVDFIHEVLHAIAYVYGGEKGVFRDKDLEEDVVCILSEAIFQVLVDNGWLKL